MSSGLILHFFAAAPVRKIPKGYPSHVSLLGTPHYPYCRETVLTFLLQMAAEDPRTQKS
jgi:hypothetical protein